MIDTGSFHIWLRKTLIEKSGTSGEVPAFGDWTILCGLQHSLAWVVVYMWGQALHMGVLLPGPGGP